MYFAKFPEQSNAGDFVTTVEVTDTDGEAYDLSGVSIAVEMQDAQGRKALDGSTSSGEVTVEGDGAFSITFRAARMKSLCAGQYRIGVVLSEGESTVQLFLGDVAVREGLPK